MTNKLYKISTLILLGMMFATLLILMQKPWQAYGSVAVGNEYTSTSTDTQANFANYRNILSNGTTATHTPGVLGSIVITNPGTSPMCFYDATSTVTNAEHATTTIACFGASATSGTYTFDANVKEGILVEFPGSATATSRASSTITFRR